MAAIYFLDRPGLFSRHRRRVFSENSAPVFNTRQPEGVGFEAAGRRCRCGLLSELLGRETIFDGWETGRSDAVAL